MHHDLITFAVAHYHAPSELIQLMTNIYDGFTAGASTKSWTVAHIRIQLGVYQGDTPPSIIFNTVMNTLVDSITQRYSATKAGSQMLSSDSSVFGIATQVTLNESQLQHASF